MLREEEKRVGRPRGSKNAPGARVGRPVGTKNKEGAKAGRPALKDKKITKSISVEKRIVDKIEENVEGKSFSEKMRIITEFYFKNKK